MNTLVTSLLKLFLYGLIAMALAVLNPVVAAPAPKSKTKQVSISKEEGRRMIAGAAYVYKEDLKKDVSLKLSDFSDVNSTPQQRFFNLLCIAYGANQELFSDFVKKGYLPEDRADECRNEAQLAFFAFNRLIMPNVDKNLARQALAKQWLPPVNRPLPRYIGPKIQRDNEAD